jgi:hypothetical protein
MALYVFFLVSEWGDRIGALHISAPSDEAAIGLMAEQHRRHPEARRIEIWDGATRRVYPSPEVKRNRAGA